MFHKPRRIKSSSLFFFKDSWTTLVCWKTKSHSKGNPVKNRKQLMFLEFLKIRTVSICVGMYVMLEYMCFSESHL